MTFDYESWLSLAQGRLETLYQQKTALESEISALEEGIKGFAPLVNQPALWFGPDAGITDAVRAVLKSDTTRIFTPTEIRDALLRRGVPLTQQNPMASIHQVLARLVEKGTARISAHEPGRNRYQWAEAEAEKAGIASRPMNRLRRRMKRSDSPKYTAEELIKLATGQPK